MSVNSEDGLSLKQERAMAALLSEPTVEKAAVAAGVSKQTLYRWLDEPAFGATFRKLRRQSFSHAISRTQHYLPRALHTLMRVMADKDASASARVSAATAVIKFARESVELDELVQRVERLEMQTNPAPR